MSIAGTQFFIHTVGSALPVSGSRVPVRPTLVVLHGGPGFEHSSLRPHLDVLADIAQVLYVDQRGHGRSEGSLPETDILPVLANDVVEL